MKRTKVDGLPPMAQDIEASDELPPMHNENYEPYVIQEKKAVIGVAADHHIPYHENGVIQLTYEHFKKIGITHLLLDGDIADCYQLSNFCKDPTKCRFPQEREYVSQFLRYTRKLFPKAKIIYVEGNHEFRWKRYLQAHAAEVYDLDEFRLPVLFGFDSLGIEWVDKKQYVQCGHLNILHGHEFSGGGYNSVNPARTLFLRAKVCAMAAHNHNTSNHDEPNMNGVPIACWSLGCQCYLHPEYMPLNKWNHGFAVVNKDGMDFEVLNKRIIDGKIR